MSAPAGLDLASIPDRIQWPKLDNWLGGRSI